MGMVCLGSIKGRLHAGAIDVRQDQRIACAISDADGRISVHVLPRYHRLIQWVNRFEVTATSLAEDSSESRFVLKHQADQPLARQRDG